MARAARARRTGRTARLRRGRRRRAPARGPARPGRARASREATLSRPPPAAATRTRPASSTSRGTGSRCSSGASRQRPARTRVVAVPAARAGQLGADEALARERPVLERASQPGQLGPVGVGRAVVQAQEQDRLAGDLLEQQSRRPRAAAARRPAPTPPSGAARARRRSICSSGEPAGAGAPASASTRSTSGAALSTASSIASLSVIADAGQPSQLPCIRTRATPSAHAEQLDVAAVGAEVGPHALQRLAHALLHADRVQAVQQQQVLDELVARRAPSPAARPTRLDDPLEPLAVELEQRLHGLERQLARGRVGEGLELARAAPRPARSAHARSTAQPPACWPPNIGECTCLSVLPPPRYMCTPQGRHGSKDRTARMMSMPRKLSGPFSSKIGWPATASS